MTGKPTSTYHLLLISVVFFVCAFLIAFLFAEIAYEDGGFGCFVGELLFMGSDSARLYCVAHCFLLFKVEPNVESIYRGGSSRQSNNNRHKNSRYKKQAPNKPRPRPTNAYQTLYPSNERRHSHMAILTLVKGINRGDREKTQPQLPEFSIQPNKNHPTNPNPIQPKHLLPCCISNPSTYIPAC